jgi:hypothetical protein
LHQLANVKPYLYKIGLYHKNVGRVKAECPGLKPRQFCLDGIECFVLKAGFEPQ